MTNKAVVLQNAFILHSRPYRDTSLIIEFFTEQQGRISAVSRGGRVKRAKQLTLQAFTPLVIAYVGHNELMTLTHIEANGVSGYLSGHQLISALYLNELLLRLLAKNDAHPKLFAYYITCLQALTDADKTESALRCFEKQLLQELGYALQLTRDADSGDAIDPQGNYYFHPEVGVRRAVDAVAKENDYQPLLFKGENLLAIDNNCYQQADSLKDAKRIMRLAINHLLGNKPLKTRELLFYR